MELTSEAYYILGEKYEVISLYKEFGKSINELIDYFMHEFNSEKEEILNDFEEYDAGYKESQIERTIQEYKDFGKSINETANYLAENFNLTKEEAIQKIEEYTSPIKKTLEVPQDCIEGRIRQAIKIYEKFGKSINEIMNYLQNEFDLTEEEAQNKIEVHSLTN